MVMRFLSVAVALAIHDRQLAEHGGAAGVKDIGLLESALARPVNKHAYGEEYPCALAAAYCFGVARNHPFVDGNKRTAWVLGRLFLAMNAVELAFQKEEAITMMIALAAGELSEAEVTAWFRAHLLAQG